MHNNKVQKWWIRKNVSIIISCYLSQSRAGVVLICNGDGSFKVFLTVLKADSFEMHQMHGNYEGFRS